MKINQPVTQKEQPFPHGRYLVSRTDLKGIITYANDTFVDISGFTRDELIGKNHNIIRHPDMPPQAFEQLWATVKMGRPWRGIVKNRCKNGDHYWVDACVVPVRENGRVTGYMSVRSEPSRRQVQEAEALYNRLRASQEKLPAGPRHWWQRITLRTRLIAAMLFMAVLMLGGAGVGITGILLTNMDLQEAYQEHLQPSLAIARMVERMGDNRSQIALALQHAPDSRYVALHDHPLDMHIDATLANRKIIEELRAEYEQRSKSSEEEALAKAFFEARDAFSREGVNAAREALKAGDFDRANLLLLTKINPLYREVVTRGEALENFLKRNGDENFRDAQQRYEIIRLLAVGGTVIGLLLIAVAGTLLMRAFVDPIEVAIRHFERIAQSDLTGEIDIACYDEIGRLMAALATMQVHLKVMLDEVRSSSLAIDEQCRRLTSEMNTVVEQSSDQRDRVQSIAAAAEEFTQSAGEVAGSAARAAEVAERSRGRIGESTQNMQESMRATSRVVEAVQSSSATIGELNHAIQKIGDITNTIKEIADQTNLLALNAAIEAARAGEQGRGFAVVADEVRKLAERTSASTADITATVVEFRNVTRAAVESMDKAVREVEEGTGRIQTSVGGLGEIRASSDEVAKMAEHIADASRQQSVASADVARNLEQIAQLVDRNSAIALEAWQQLERLGNSAEQLMAIVKKFRLRRD